MSAVALARVADRLSPVQGLFRGGRFIGRVTCASCDAHEEWTAMSMPQPEVVKKKLVARGWRIDRRCTCPACLAKPKETIVKPAQPLSTKPQPPFDAKAALRLLSRVLDDEAYDHPNQRYKPGFSDASLAKDTGLHEKAVAAERERLCGPVGVPQFVIDCRDEQKGLFQKAEAMMEQAAALRNEIVAGAKRLEDACARHGFA